MASFSPPMTAGIGAVSMPARISITGGSDQCRTARPIPMTSGPASASGNTPKAHAGATDRSGPSTNSTRGFRKDAYAAGACVRRARVKSPASAAAPGGCTESTSPGLLYDIFKEGPRDVAIEQAIAILGERGWRPHGIVPIEADKPAKQQVVFELIHQHPLAAHRISTWSSSARRRCSGGIDGRSSHTGSRTAATNGAAHHRSSRESPATDGRLARAVPGINS
jgi:hypothetical protein